MRIGEHWYFRTKSITGSYAVLATIISFDISKPENVRVRYHSGGHSGIYNVNRAFKRGNRGDPAWIKTSI